MKLLSDPSKHVWYIDGFAGQGRDDAGNPGSPLIASEVARGVLEAKGQRNGEAPMQVIAIEQNKERFERLRMELARYTHRDPTIAYAASGTLGDYISRISRGIRANPALYFLDPYGIKGLKHEDYVRALAGPQNEIFVLFSDTGAHRLHASLLSTGRNLELELAELRQQPGLFPSLEEAEEEQRADAIERSNCSLEATQRAAREYLAEALGVDINALVTGEAAVKQAEDLTRLFTQRLRDAGAEYVLRFPMRNEQSNEVYQLVFATKSAAGLRAMKEAMHAGLNSGQLPDKATEAIRRDLLVDEEELIEQIGSRFGGRRVRWTEGKNRGRTDTVKRFLLEQTPAFPWQFKQIKSALRSGGYEQKDSPIVYEF